ncbi:MAG: hypothetical protein WAM81_11395 [Acidimicrobiia bacterium]
MQALDIAALLASGASVHPLSSGTNSVFRVTDVGGATSILKVYGSTSYQRRERRALEALDGLQGLPAIIEWGATEGSDWVRFADHGRWSLASLPGDSKAASKAGALLHHLHEADFSRLSNLEEGIGSIWMETALRGNFARLERYRRRLNIPSAVFDRAVDLTFPKAGPPKASHTRPSPSAFVIDDAGTVTLTGWTWATLAPPEWDYTFTYWQLAKHEGAGDAFASGYGATVGPEVLKAWIVFHITALLLREAENRDGRLDDLRPYVDQLDAAI